MKVSVQISLEDLHSAHCFVFLFSLAKYFLYQLKQFLNCWIQIKLIAKLINDFFFLLVFICILYFNSHMSAINNQKM